MNFLVAVIYVAVQDEVVAFSVLQRIMQSKKEAQRINASLPKEMLALHSGSVMQAEWRFLYTDGMKKLNAFVKEIKDWILRTKRLLYIHLESRNVVLEALLSNPFLSLFSNVVPNE